MIALDCEGGHIMPTKKNLTVRLDDRTRVILELIANREMRPVANQINFFLKQEIDLYLKKNNLHLAINGDPETGEEELILSHPYQ
jgi:hypothetical protein